MQRAQGGNYYYNGMDRVDNAVGYMLDNVVPSCWDCNRTKGKRTRTWFKAYVRRLATYMLGMVDGPETAPESLAVTRIAT